MADADGIRAFLTGQWGPAIPVAVAAGLILLRNRRPRKLKIERMWMIPALYGVMLGVMFYYQPPPLTFVALGAIAVGLVVGAGIGWQRARFTRLDIDPDTHEMTAQASLLGVVLILALMLGRRLLQNLVQSGDLGGSGLTLTTATDALAVFAVGTLATQRLEIWLRASKMLEEARARPAGAKTGDDGPTPPLVQ